MTPTEFHIIREYELKINQQELAILLGMKNTGARTIRRWETHVSNIPIPVQIIMHVIRTKEGYDLIKNISNHIQTTNNKPSM